MARRIKADMNEGKKLGTLDSYQAEVEKNRKELLQ